jgi:hypothetical protein
VDDVAAEVAQFRARGVQIQDLPELGTVDGIADIGFALAAWFTDPHHNSIGPAAPSVAIGGRGPRRHQRHLPHPARRHLDPGPAAADASARPRHLESGPGRRARRQPRWQDDGHGHAVVEVAICPDVVWLAARSLRARSASHHTAV